MVASRIKINYLTNLGNRREHERFKHTSEPQISRNKTPDCNSPPSPSLLGQKITDLLPLLPLPTYRLRYRYRLKCPQKNRKRKHFGFQNFTIESLNISELTIIVVFQGYRCFRLKMLIHLYTFFWGVEGIVEEFVTTKQGTER